MGLVAVGKPGRLHLEVAKLLEKVSANPRPANGGPPKKGGAIAAQKRDWLLPTRGHGRLQGHPFLLASR